MSPLDRAEDLAKKLAGNHRKFGSFAWFARPEDDARWCLVYTHNRDSGCLEESNAHVISEALAPFCTGEDDADCRAEEHSHWAVGWVGGFAIRVYAADGTLTKAFLAYAELRTALDDYPVLDEDDYSERAQEEADRVWADCYTTTRRIAYVREHRDQFEFRDWADMLGCIRGRYFAGYASELIDS